MSHPVSPSGPNIAPKAEEGAALCALGKRAREGPRHPTLLHPGPRSRPEPQPSRTPSHQRRASRGVGKERVPPRRRDRFLFGECGTRSRGQRIGQGAFPCVAQGMRPRSQRTAITRGGSSSPLPPPPRAPPRPSEPPHKEMFVPGRRGLWAAARLSSLLPPRPGRLRTGPAGAA